MKWRRLLIGMAMYSMATLTSVFAQTSQTNSGGKLVFLNWPDYMDPAVLEAFTKETGIAVQEVYFESDDLRDDMVAEHNGQGYDIVCLNELGLESYHRRGWLAPIQSDRMPNLKHVDMSLTMSETLSPYGVPIFWGTFGIAYRSDLVPEPITTWRQLYEPAEALRGRIMMLPSSSELVGMALKALGFSWNTEDPKHLRAAEELLRRQQPFVRAYATPTLDEKSPLVTGEIVATMAYNGDALQLQAFCDKIVYVLPAEGALRWVDFLAVMASSPHPAEAMRFINYLHDPAVMARLAQYLRYAPVNSAAEALLPAEFKANRLIYPEVDQVGRCDRSVLLSPKVRKRHIDIFRKILPQK